MISSPWLNTRSTEALDAVTDSTRIAKGNSLLKLTKTSFCCSRLSDRMLNNLIFLKCNTIGEKNSLLKRDRL